MKIPSEDILQADSPERVMATVAAIGNGARTDKEIAVAIGNLDARQGRYYRRAAEILGFIRRDAGNFSVLTELGSGFVDGSTHQRNELFVRAVLGNSVIQRLVPFVESCGAAGASRTQLENFLGSVASLGTASMVKRRVSSYVGWLRHFGLTAGHGNRLVLASLPDASPILRFQSDVEPISPQNFELREYEEQRRRVVAAGEAVAYFINQAAHERAAASHEALVNLMARRLRTHGAVPKANRYVDLSARWAGVDYLFEMKSTTEANPHSQIRRGISQLYEYRYIQNIPAAKLVLVVENSLPRKLSWLQNYLVKDRDVLLVWDGNGSFSCPTEIAPALPFLV
jgi:hypothetical protein